ncbi:hypothetical protein S83_047273, partial [Arachis hypogaea]
NLTELDIQENVIDDKNDNWLTYFPESFTSLEVLNFSIFHNDVNFDAIEKLVTRCKSLKTLKLNKSIALEQLQRLLFRAPQLCELGTDSFSQELTTHAFSNCKNLNTRSGLWVVKPQYLPVLYPACANMTFLNFSYAPLDSDDIAKLLVYCANIRRLWVRIFFPVSTTKDICNMLSSKLIHVLLVFFVSDIHIHTTKDLASCTNEFDSSCYNSILNVKNHLIIVYYFMYLFFFNDKNSYRELLDIAEQAKRCTEVASKASKMVEHHYVNASDLNLLEAHEAEASLAGRGAYTLMVGLTLIQIAAAKGA